ncbi:MAG: CDF family Co(II)/Ni(II) efflux transporter DmeF [Limisphaerales bacterium]
MHKVDRKLWGHSHEFTADFSVAERRTRIVIAITATMMVIEIAAGLAFNSMALLADGWHMSTHVAAFLIAAVAYHFSRRHSADPRYSFGTGKMGVLGGYTSAVVLLIVALMMAVESFQRFFNPVPIRFNDAILVAVLGLIVNLVCAFIFAGAHHHHHHHHHGGAHHHHDDHDHEHGHHHHHDLNLRAAYIHVLADALTSVAAIIALTGGKYLGWAWLDPLMGIVGAIVVIVWAYTLLRDTSGILLDRTPESSDLPEEIRKAVEMDGDAFVSDLHVWQVSAGKFAAIVSIVAEKPKSVEAYQALFREHEELVHVTIETRQYSDQGPRLSGL